VLLEARGIIAIIMSANNKICIGVDVEVTDEDE
jgi:hypothetical protein